MNPYRLLLFVQLAPIVMIFPTFVLLFEPYPRLAMAALALTLVFGFLGMRIKCPNCGRAPQLRNHPDIPFRICAPRWRDQCPHCHAPLSRLLPDKEWPIQPPEPTSTAAPRRRSRLS